MHASRFGGLIHPKESVPHDQALAAPHTHGVTASRRYKEYSSVGSMTCRPR